MTTVGFSSETIWKLCRIMKTEEIDNLIIVTIPSEEIQKLVTRKLTQESLSHYFMEYMKCIVPSFCQKVFGTLDVDISQDAVVFRDGDLVFSINKNCIH